MKHLLLAVILSLASATAFSGEDAIQFLGGVIDGLTGADERATLETCFTNADQVAKQVEEIVVLWEKETVESIIEWVE